MPRFICGSCNYKFNREAFDMRKSQCPYCGKKGTVKREESASEILDQVGSFED